MTFSGDDKWLSWVTLLAYDNHSIQPVARFPIHMCGCHRNGEGGGEGRREWGKRGRGGGEERISGLVLSLRMRARTCVRGVCACARARACVCVVYVWVCVWGGAFVPSHSCMQLSVCPIESVCSCLREKLSQHSKVSRRTGGLVLSIFVIPDRSTRLRSVHRNSV